MDNLSDEGRRNLDALRKALTDDPAALIDYAVTHLVMLGANLEWSMEHNFDTTETLAALPGIYGLPEAGDQDPEAHRFYAAAAHVLGIESDYEEDSDGD